MKQFDMPREPGENGGVSYNMFVYQGSKESLNYLNVGHKFNHNARHLAEPKFVYGKAITSTDISEMRKYVACCVKGERFEVFRPKGYCSGHAAGEFFIENGWDLSPGEGGFKCFHRPHVLFAPV